MEWKFILRGSKLKRCSKKECCKQFRYVKVRAQWQNGPYKNQHTERHKNTKNTMTQQIMKISYDCKTSTWNLHRFVYLTFPSVYFLRIRKRIVLFRQSGNHYKNTFNLFLHNVFLYLGYFLHACCVQNKNIV